jgi:hypothetical protein
MKKMLSNIVALEMTIFSFNYAGWPYQDRLLGIKNSKPPLEGASMFNR